MSFSINRFLREKGWKRLWGSWWYKPIPGWKGSVAFNQELFGTARAFDLERRKLMGENVSDPVDAHMKMLEDLG